MRILFALFFAVGFSTKHIYSESESGWMWHGTFPWVFSDDDNEWWYMHSGEDGKFYAFKNGDKEWYAWSAKLVGWAPVGKTISKMKEEAESYLEAGNFDDALAAFEKALASSIDKYETDDPRIAEVIEGIAACYFAKGNYALALEKAEKALAHKLKTLDTNDLAVSDSHYGIGQIQILLGKDKEALVHLERALSIRIEKLEQDDPKVASAHRVLGDAQANLFDLTESYSSYQTALGILLSAENANEEELASTLMGLAGHQVLDGDFEKALKNSLEALEIAERLYPTDNFALIPFYKAMVLVHQTNGNYDQLIEFAQKALSISLGSFGPNHPATADAFIILGDSQYNLLQYKDALGNYRSAAEILQITVGEDHPNTIRAYLGIGAILHTLGKSEEALSNYKKAMELSNQVLDKNDPLRTNSHRLFISLNSNPTEYREALVAHIENVEGLVGKNSYLTSLLYGLLGSLDSQQGEITLATQNLQIALARASLAFQPDHPVLGSIHYYTGLHNFNLGNFDKALADLNKALEIFEGKIGQENSSVRQIYYLIGVINSGKKDFQKSLQNLMRSLEITNLLNEDSYLGLGHVYYAICMAHFGLYDYENAELYLEKAEMAHQANYNQYDEPMITVNKTRANFEYIKELRDTGQTKLDLSNSANSDIHWVGGLTQLQELTLPYFNLGGFDHNITDISAISNLINLTVLVLPNNSISDLTPLTGLTKLEYLDLSNNHISDISPLVRLTNLKTLFLSNNNISDLSPLAGLTNLNFLDLSNFILEGNDIDSLINLNQISDLNPLSGLTNLVILVLHNNKISDLSPLAGLMNLNFLSLDGNKISSYQKFTLEQALTEIDIQW